MIIENISLNLREFNTILVVDTSGVVYTSSSLVSWTFFIIVIVSIIIIFASLFLTYRFSRPLARLKEVTGIIAKGNFDYSIPITSFDEIGELSALFNTNGQ